MKTIKEFEKWDSDCKQCAEEYSDFEDLDLNDTIKIKDLRESAISDVKELKELRTKASGEYCAYIDGKIEYIMEKNNLTEDDFK